MKRKFFTRLALTALVVGGLGQAVAQDRDRIAEQAADTLRMRDQLQERDRFPGAALLTDQERNTYMERLRLARTEQERERIREEFREKMALRERALSWRDGRTPDASAPMRRAPMMNPPMRRPGRN
jgi:hypothetical protein